MSTPEQIGNGVVRGLNAIVSLQHQHLTKPTSQQSFPHFPIDLNDFIKTHSIITFIFIVTNLKKKYFEVNCQLFCDEVD